MAALRVEPALAAVAACATAVRDPDHWSEVARLAAQALGASRGVIGFLTASHDFLYRACPDTDPDWHASYDADMHAINDVWAKAARLRPGQVQTPGDQAARRRYLASGIYNEFIRPQGMDALLTLSLTDPRRGCVGLLTVGRRQGAAPFDRADCDAARMLAGALARSLHAAGPVLSSGPVLPPGSVPPPGPPATGPSAGPAVGPAVGQPVTAQAPARDLLVTPDGRILRHEAWLEPWIRGGVFDVTGGVLVSPHLPALAAAIRATGRTPDGWPPPVGITIGPVRTAMGTIRLALSPGGKSGRGAVRIRIDPEPAEPAETALARRFGLTPRECDIALLLASGLTLPEAAETLDMGLTTARTHLSRLFDKTDTRTQLRLGLLLQRALTGQC